jgi:hypothetical protein
MVGAPSVFEADQAEGEYSELNDNTRAANLRCARDTVVIMENRKQSPNEYTCFIHTN